MEFLVSCTIEIEWNLSAFQNLAIRAEHKKIFLTLAKAYLSRGPDDKFNDFIEGKRQGLIALLQYVVRSLTLSHELTSSRRPHRNGQDIDSGNTVRTF